MSGSSRFAVHRIVAGPWAQNCYVVCSHGGDAVIVDPGGKPEAIGDCVAANRLRVHAVLNTHGHHDHLGALAQVVEAHGVPFGIHSGEAPVLGRVNFCRFAFHGLGPVEIPPVEFDLGTVTQLEFGDVEIAVVHTPGHTPGSVCFDLGGALLTGDALTGAPPGRSGLPESDQASLETSVRNLARHYRPDTVVYPGHGEPARLDRAVAELSAGVEAPA